MSTVRHDPESLRRLSDDKEFLEQQNSDNHGSINNNHNNSSNISGRTPTSSTPAVLFVMESSQNGKHNGKNGNGNHNNREISSSARDDYCSETSPSATKRSKRSSMSKTAHIASLAFIENVAIGCCLRPGYSLRRQLLSTFGFLTALSLIVLTFITLLTAGLTTRNVKAEATSALHTWADRTVTSYATNSIESIYVHVMLLWTSLRLLRVVTQERLRGYPAAPGYVNDTLTPFRTGDTSNPSWIPSSTFRTIYPLKAPRLLPFPWEVVGNVNDTNAVEHLQDHRLGWYDGLMNLSTAEASVFVAGQCNPNIDNINNNNTRCNSATSPTFSMLHERVSEFATPFLKAIYESVDDLKVVGLYLFNDGDGMSVTFPSFSNAHNTNATYVSSGCDWLLLKNPLNRSKTIGTSEQADKCHPAGTQVPFSQYNPVETAWFQKVALNPFVMGTHGPFPDRYNGDTINSHFVLGQGEAIYDVETQELIGVVFFDLPLTRAAQNLEYIQYVQTGEAAWIEYDSSTVSFSYPSHQKDKLLQPSDVGIPMDLLDDMRAEWEMRYRTGNVRQDMNVFRRNGRMYSFAVFPSPPPRHDPNFVPTDMLVCSIEESVITNSLGQLNEDATSSTRSLIRSVMIVGMSGLIIVSLVLWFVSMALTVPMRWMREIGEAILASAGSVEKPDDQVKQLPWIYKYTPRSEISYIVNEFQLLTEKFAGSGTAKLVKRQMLEVKNPFTLHDNFQELYDQRDDPDFKYNMMRDAKNAMSPRRERFGFRMSWGPNMHPESAQLVQRSLDNLLLVDEEMENEEDDNKRKCILWKSPLFRYLFLCIVVPLSVTMLIIAGNGIIQILSTFPPLISRVEADYKTLEVQRLIPTVKLRSNLASRITTMAYRDLHLFTRLTGWTYFGGVNLHNESYTTILSSSEICKNYEKGNCPPIANSPISTCDCAWVGADNKSCRNYSKDLRYLQHVSFSGQSQDVIWPVGTRNTTSFPKLATRPDNTAFWSTLDSVPGANLSTHDVATLHTATTNDRLRVVAASSVIQIPLFNYVEGIPALYRNLGTFMGFEEDGLFAMYAGCSSTRQNDAFFQSSESNNAGRYNPTLCPMNKFG